MLLLKLSHKSVSIYDATVRRSGAWGQIAQH